MAVNAAILSLIIAFIRRGRVSGIADVFDQARHFWLIVVPLVLVLGLWFGGSVIPPVIWRPLAGWIHIVYTIAFICFFAANLKFTGMWFMMIGQLMNLLPVVANAGKMPVSEAASKIAGAGDVHGEFLRHVAMSDTTRFNFLSDVIPIPFKYIPGGVISPGDILIAVGLFVLIQVAMCPRKKRQAGAQDA